MAVEGTFIAEQKGAACRGRGRPPRPEDNVEEEWKGMEKLTEQGRSIILISSYLPEVMGLADRLIVMAQGKITGEFDKEELKTLREEDVLRRASIEG